MSLSKEEFLTVYDNIEAQLMDLLKFNTLRTIHVLKDVKDNQLLSVLDRFEPYKAPAGEPSPPARGPSAPGPLWRQTRFRALPGGCRGTAANHAARA